MTYRETKFWPYYPAQLVPLGAELEKTHKGTFGWIICGVSQGENVEVTIKRKGRTGKLKLSFDQTVYVFPYGRRLD